MAFCREVRVHYCKICSCRILFEICFLYNTCIILYNDSYCPAKEMLIDSFKTEGNTPDICLTVFGRVELKILFLYQSKQYLPTLVLYLK